MLLDWIVKLSVTVLKITINMNSPQGLLFSIVQQFLLIQIARYIRMSPEVWLKDFFHSPHGPVSQQCTVKMFYNNE